MPAPRTEFAQALRAIVAERGLDSDVIVDSIKHAIVAAYRRDARERGEEVEGFEYEVEIDSTTGEAKVFSWPDGEPEKKEDVTPPGFGRIAAQTAKQVIHQKIREAEKGAIMDEFSDRIGSLISGMILRFDGPDVRVDLGRTEGVMPAGERVPNDRLNSNQRLTFLLKDIEETSRGKKVVLSRSDPEFVSKLFEREVPEMASGSVEVRAIAREPGVRTKLAVSSNQSGVDPVGSCVGQKGVRVQAVTNELGGERVDIIPWTEKTEDLIEAALSPAENLSVTLDEEEKIAVVKAPEDQLSLAIGKDGQNARLAAKLTGYKIEIKELKTGKDAEDKLKELVEEDEEESEKKEGEKSKKSKKGKEKESDKDKKEPSGAKEKESEKKDAKSKDKKTSSKTASDEDEEAEEDEKESDEKTKPSDDEADSEEKQENSK